MTTKPTFETILISQQEGIGIITLNHGKVNALSRQLIDDLCAALEHMTADTMQVVILRAAKDVKVFSAGHDVRELPTNGRDPLTYNDPLRHAVRTIEQHPAPIIAMVEGQVWGGACELVMACDLVVAGNGSLFALTPARLGIPYNLSGTLNFLKVAGMHLVKEMLFTAQPIGAERLAASGVINYVVPLPELESFTMDLAKRITETSPLVHRILKEEVRVLANAHPLNPESYERIQSLRREVYDSSDYQEGIRAFFEKRKPEFRGK
ncbi:MAG TPA: methylmalonyl-CoA decarboxylase [Terriglobales bacterium]|jgi:methylmalonyl-CoA decarboxylase|nr:methylmalonyl-CoA decarboxylase [Terriglobales bacterium]